MSVEESCDKASNCLCRPALVAVVDINMRSSAYSPERQEGLVHQSQLFQAGASLNQHHIGQKAI